MKTTATFLMIKIALVFIVGIEHIGICLFWNLSIRDIW